MDSDSQTVIKSIKLIFEANVKTTSYIIYKRYEGSRPETVVNQSTAVQGHHVVELLRPLITLWVLWIFVINLKPPWKTQDLECQSIIFLGHSTWVMFKSTPFTPYDFFHVFSDDITMVICPGIGNHSEKRYIRTFVDYSQRQGYRCAVLNHLGALPNIELTSPRMFTYGRRKAPTITSELL